MFDFEKLNVYRKAKVFNDLIKVEVLSNPNLDKIYRDQIKRASISVARNIAEGAGRFSKADKRNFYVVARGSLAECVAILDLLQSDEIVSAEKYNSFYIIAEEISKMLYAMIREFEENSIKKS